MIEAPAEFRNTQPIAKRWPKCRMTPRGRMTPRVSLYGTGWLRHIGGRPRPSNSSLRDPPPVGIIVPALKVIECGQWISSQGMGMLVSRGDHERSGAAGRRWWSPSWTVPACVEWEHPTPVVFRLVLVAILFNII